MRLHYCLECRPCGIRFTGRIPRDTYIRLRGQWLAHHKGKECRPAIRARISREAPLTKS